MATKLPDSTLFTKCVFLATGALFFLYFRSRRNSNPRGLPLPPGPKSLPLVGSLFSIPATVKPWLAYAEWAKQYGDIFYFEVLGQSFLVLSSLERVHDIFDKRSANYSDRTPLTMLVELIGFDFNMAMMPYGSWWRRHRRLFNEYFHQNAVHQYQPIQTRGTRAFLQRLLVTPEDFMHHTRHTFAATIMDVTYGIKVKDFDDPYIIRAERSLEGLAAAGVPGSFLVDFVPALKYVPSWFPGASFKRKAAVWRRYNGEVAGIPFQYVEDKYEQGSAPPSVAASMIGRLPNKGDPTRDEERIVARNAAALAYLGNVSALQSFFLAMTIYQDVQKKAKEELDHVVGSSRLPEFHDRKDLPYINAIVKETMRWNLVNPLAFGHMSTEDDEYDGFFIPKGTIVIGNAWLLLHDPAVFSDPEEFQPERYLKNGQLDPDARDPDDCGAFGYGRRKCPGRHFSDNSLFSIISSVLSVYDIKPPLDEDGKSVQVEVQYTSGLLIYPVPFKCIIKPRSAAAEVLTRECLEGDHE
ncbi:cytochrome P450 [Agrocybe pediades]|nr:cytochrome P450 [Agrocybe pediades]